MTYLQSNLLSFSGVPIIMIYVNISIIYLSFLWAGSGVPIIMQTCLQSNLLPFSGVPITMIYVNISIVYLSPVLWAGSVVPIIT